VAAGACGLSDTGLLAPGKRADLLAVDGNPLLDITDLERVQLVVSNGNVVVGPARH
jgi:imidazolonepropionase-like amidohydrolase